MTGVHGPVVRCTVSPMRTTELRVPPVRGISISTNRVRSRISARVGRGRRFRSEGWARTSTEVEILQIVLAETAAIGLDVGRSRAARLGTLTHDFDDFLTAIRLGPPGMARIDAVDDSIDRIVNTVVRTDALDVPVREVVGKDLAYSGDDVRGRGHGSRV